MRALRIVSYEGPSAVELASDVGEPSGADGVVVEVHPDPENAICDGPQQLRSEDFASYLRRMEQVAEIAGKELASRV